MPPLTERTLDLPAPHAGQKTIWQSSARFKVICAGRRWGKTQGECLRLFIKASEKEGGVYGWVAPYYKNTSIPFRYMTNKRRFPLHPRGIVAKVNKSERCIELVNGSLIKFGSADNPDSLLGEGYDGLVLDEAARIEERVWQETLYPALSDKRGWADLISTPKGKNWFYRLFCRGNDNQYPDYKSFHFPSSDNPYLDLEVLEQMRLDLPEDIYRQEILAEFLDDGAGVFVHVRDNMRGQILQPMANHRYCVGVDLAKHTDFTVITVLDGMARLVYFDRFQSIDWPEQVARVSDTAKRYNNAFTVIDSTGLGDPVYDLLVAKGVNVYGYGFTNESKRNLVHGLRLGFERQLLSLPDVLQLKQLFHELDIFTYDITKAGNVRYSAPTGEHDDCVMSLALAYWGIGVPNQDTVLTRDVSYELIQMQDL